MDRQQTGNIGQNFYFDSYDDLFLEGTSNIYSGYDQIMDDSIEAQMYLTAFNTLKGLFTFLGGLLLPVYTRMDYDLVNNQFKQNINLKNFAIPEESNNQKRLDALNISIKDEWICPITKELCDNPVSSGASHKHFYEKEALEQWLKVSKEDPVTREPITYETMVIENKIKEEIEDFLTEKERTKAKKQLAV